MSPVDVNGVHVAIAELGDLEVVLLDILLVVEVSPTVGGNSFSISLAYQVQFVSWYFKMAIVMVIVAPGFL